MLRDQIETPALILEMDAFERNMRRMAEFAQSRELGLRPHYKSHKSATIAHMQIKSGAKGVCCAKISEAEDLTLAGIEDVLLANEVVTREKIARAASLARCCRLTVCVDDARNVEELSVAAHVQEATLYCYVEYDIGMNRCGVGTHDAVLALARKVVAAPNLVFSGIQAYAGHIAHETDFTRRSAASVEIERDLRDLKKHLEANGLAVEQISGASTGTAFLRPDGSIYTEIQPGSYLFMDTSYGALGLEFENALFVLTSAVSLNEKRTIFDAGAKSLGMDQRPPRFLEYPDLPVTFNEEHCSIPFREAELERGGKRRLIPGHCCTTVNLYDFLYMVRDGKVADRIPITSRGKNL